MRKDDISPCIKVAYQELAARVSSGTLLMATRMPILSMKEAPASPYDDYSVITEVVIVMIPSRGSGHTMNETLIDGGVIG